MTLSIILGVIASIIILESLFVLLFPLTTNKMLKKVSKSKKTIRELGLIEFILGFLLFLISIVIRVN